MHYCAKEGWSFLSGLAQHQDLDMGGLHETYERSGHSAEWLKR